MSVLDELHPQTVTDEHGNPVAVQISVVNYRKMVEMIEDIEDVRISQERLQNDEIIPFDQACAEYNL